MFSKYPTYLAVLSSLFSLTACVTVTEGEPKQEADPQAMAESRIALGLGYMEKGNLVRARENLEQAIKHAPNYYRAQLSMAHFYETVGDLEYAKTSYQRAIRNNPKNGNVLNNYGTFLCKQGEFEQADRYFNKAIEQPYYYLTSASYENAALCALKAQKSEKAQYYFSRALDHDPNRARSILQLAKLEIENNQFTEARVRLMKFHRMYGYQVPSLAILIELEAKAGNEALEEKYKAKLDSLRG